MLPRAALAGALFLLAGVGAGKVESWRVDAQMNGSEVATRVTGRVVADGTPGDGSHPVDPRRARDRAAAIAPCARARAAVGARGAGGNTAGQRGEWRGGG